MKNRPTGLDWLEQALRRMAAQRAANLARFASFDARVEEMLKRAGERRTRGAGRPPKPPRKGRPDEGGEPMPAIPRPKPKPLSGGAEAPIEREQRLTKSASQPMRVKGRPSKVPSEADRSPSL
jgi:hypothetical protein